MVGEEEIVPLRLVIDTEYQLVEGGGIVSCDANFSGVALVEALSV
jgi:hypothetical protein